MVAGNDVAVRAVYRPLDGIEVSLARQGGGTVACADVAGYKIGLATGTVDLSPYARLDVLMAGSGTVLGGSYDTLVIAAAPPPWAAASARLLESDGITCVWVRPGESAVWR